MKKTAFITVHVGFNFGSVLQSIATAKVLRTLNFDPLLINYIPDRVTYHRYFQNALKGIIPFIKHLVLLPNFMLNRHIYSSYLSKYCKMSKPIYDNDDFAKKCPKADIYITGSDQVWNSKHNEGFNDRYYLTDTPEESTRIAFASSIGETRLSREDLIRIKKNLQRYKAISVREQSAQKLIESLGLKAKHLLDPTFMLDKDEWKEYMSPRLEKRNYLLIYTPYNTVDNNKIYDAARKIAKEKNLKILTFSWDWRKEKPADRTITYASPGDFLSLMHHADFVITNSFHGTAFSINLNKNFIVFMPSAFSTRITSIIELCNLSHRLIKKDFSLDCIKDSIDYNKVNTILNAQRKESINFLSEALN